MSAPQKPEPGPRASLARMREELAAGAYEDARTFALAAIAEALVEQGQPIERVIDLDELERQQRPILLTESQITLAAESLQEQTAIASLGFCRTIAARMIRHVNETSR